MAQADTPAKAWLVDLSGLLAALFVAVWMRPSGTPGLFAKAVAVAAVWAAVTVLGGTFGIVAAESFVAGRPRSPKIKTVMGALSSWMLIPPMLLCWLRGSGWAAVMGAVIGAMTAIGLWQRTPRAGATALQEPWAAGPHFSNLPKPDSRRPAALAIAICVELAVVLADRGAVLLATALTAMAGYLLVWKWLASLDAKVRDELARPAARAAGAALLAMLVLIPLLLARFARMNGSVETEAQAATRTRVDAGKGDAADAYQGIVLFTVQEKKKELPPVPIERDQLKTGTAKPLVIPFDGSYWYFQAPRQGPGLHPHLAHGDPVAVAIYSTGWVPLAMQAHQTLAQPIDLRSCSALQVTLKNGDNRRGRIDLGVLLADSTMPGKPTLFLGTEPMLSTEPEHFSIKLNPVTEEVRFVIPQRRGITKFDEITVLFFPDTERATLGARVGIEQFELMPR